MNRSLSIIIFLTLITFSCKKETSIPTSGTTTISTELFGTDVYYTYGFSFAKAAKVKFPGQSADFAAVAIFGGENNALTGALFNIPDYSNGFNKTAEFDNLADAEAYFNAYKNVTATQFILETGALQPGEVYTFKTRSDTYAKLLILAVSLDTSEVNNHFAEIEFRWQYQPDGTTTFQ
jgi:hypothetical protein